MLLADLIREGGCSGVLGGYPFPQEQLNLAVKIEANDIASHFFDSLGTREWMLSSDFSSLIPPEKELWIEMKPTYPTQVPRWGFLVSTNDLSELSLEEAEAGMPPPARPLVRNSRWLVSSLVVIDHPDSGPIGPLATVNWLLDESGVIPAMEDGNASLITVPYGVSDQGEFNESIRRVKELIYPTLLAISVMNDGSGQLEMMVGESITEYQQLRLAVA